MDLLELAQILAEQATRQFPEKIGIIAVYGSVALGTYGEFSDLDMYAIVDEKEDTNLPWSFEYAGCPVDFWQMTWEDAKNMAYGTIKAPWAVAASNFINAKILYSRSLKDQKRFQELQKTTQISVERNAQRAIATLIPAFFHLERMHSAKDCSDLLSIRWAAWQVLNSVVKTLSLLNNRFFTKNWGSNLHEAFKLPEIPSNFKKKATILATSNDFDKLVNAGRNLLEDTQKLVINRLNRIKVKSKEPLQRIKEDIIGISSYLQKIRKAIITKDILAASYAVSELQIWIASELAQLENKAFINLDKVNFYYEVSHFYETFGFPDFSEAITTKDFEKLAELADAFQAVFEKFCVKYNLKIPRITNIGEITNAISTKK
ncbi:MAG: hypothetical protein ACE5I5_11635 [Candidatus Heimdallarchaeota archaeon]